MSQSPCPIQFADRCRLLATAVLILGVPALIFTDGMVGGATLGIVILALVWTSRKTPALRRRVSQFPAASRRIFPADRAFLISARIAVSVSSPMGGLF